MQEQSFIDSRNSVVFTETWKRFPEFYNETNLSEEYEIIAQWKNRLADALLVDAGCGCGRLMEVWAGLGVQFVIFVDISDALYKAKDIYQAKFSHKFKALFIRANLKNIPLTDRCAPTTCSNGVIHHTDNQGEALREIFRVTKGRVFLGIISEKTLVGRVHIFPNLIKPVINRMNNFDFLYHLTSIITATGMFAMQMMYYT
jgi:ubiquinone/menaquinone biosynthesis C-methylase UbiE